MKFEHTPAGVAVGLTTAHEQRVTRTDVVAGSALSSAAASADGVDEPVGSCGGVSGCGTSGKGSVHFRPEGQVDGSRGPSPSPGPNSRVR